MTPSVASARGGILPANVNTPQAELESEQRTTVHAVMVREVRSWGLWQLGLGAVHLIGAGQLSAPWGVLLIVVGLASLGIQDAALFVVYASTLVWAALANATGGGAGWAGLAAFQCYLAFRVWQQFRRFRDAQYADTAPATRTTAARLFPIAAPALGLASLLAVIVAVAATGSQASAETAATFILNTAVNVAVLGFACGLSALLCKFRHRGWAMLGLILNGLVLVSFLAIGLLGS